MLHCEDQKKATRSSVPPVAGWQQALATLHGERPHAVLAHVGEVHRLDRIAWRSHIPSVDADCAERLRRFETKPQLPTGGKELGPCSKEGQSLPRGPARTAPSMIRTSSYLGECSAGKSERPAHTQ